jgi:hypothetical protein
MPRPRKAPTAEIPTQSDALAGAVERLCDELHILREVIDDIREDFSWVTRNGLPLQPIEHVVVHRMARDPCGADWNEKLELRRTEIPGRWPAPTLDVEVLDRIAETLTTTVETVAQGQLEAVLSALDVVRNQILSALDHDQGESLNPPAISAPSIPPVHPPLEKPDPGRLF